jgi:hypothetical protein
MAPAELAKVCEACGRSFVAVGANRIRMQRYCHVDCCWPVAVLARADLSKGHPVLYRYWSASGGLLYVGITEHFWSRLRSHRVQAPWWPAVAWVTVTAGTSRAQVVWAESVAIYVERPLWNREVFRAPRPMHPAQWVRWTEGRWAEDYALRTYGRAVSEGSKAAGRDCRPGGHSGRTSQGQGGGKRNSVT